MRIALIGGTADADGLAKRLLDAGVDVEVSTASDLPLTLPCHPHLTRHSGVMDQTKMVAWLRKIGACALLDAAHPYATTLHTTAPLAAQETGIPYVLFLRASMDTRIGKRVYYAKTHDEAAKSAFSFGRNVLLTIGVKNIIPYAEEAKRKGLLFAARVLNHKNSINACHEVGLPEERIIVGTGPFSVEDNIRHLQSMDCGVLVTKDGGAAGGYLEKLAAAEQLDVEVVFVERPTPPNGVKTFSDMDEAVRETIRLAFTQSYKKS